MNAADTLEALPPGGLARSMEIGQFALFKKSHFFLWRAFRRQKKKKSTARARKAGQLGSSSKAKTVSAANVGRRGGTRKDRFKDSSAREARPCRANQIGVHRAKKNASGRREGRPEFLRVKIHFGEPTALAPVPYSARSPRNRSHNRTSV